MKQIDVRANDANQRLDKFLLKTFPNLSKSMMYKAIRNKKIKINRKRCTFDQILDEGDSVMLFLPPDALTEKRRPIPKGSKDLKIVYEDTNILIVNKPAGLLSQSDTNRYQDSLVSRIQKYLYDKGEYDVGEHSFAPAICHRLDRNTQGLVIACKNAKSLRIVNASMADRKVKKYYRTSIQGTPRSGMVALYIKKVGTKAFVSDRNEPGYQSAQMQIRVLSSTGPISHIEIELHTGRFHQIRACMAYLGHPLVGDVKYGYHGDRKHFVLKAYKLDLTDVDLELSKKVFQI